MDKVEYYRQCVQKILEKYSQTSLNESEIETQLLVDTLRDHYQLMRIGWQELKRIYYIILHFDIKNQKIWIQQNTTDIDIGQELLAMGVPKEDIILGLHPPYKRPYTNYGVA